MESLFPYMENFLAYLGDEEWLATSDPEQVFNKAFRNAHFIENLFIRLKNENQIEEFIHKFSLHKNQNPANLNDRLMQYACDEVIRFMYMKQKNKKSLQIGSMEYIKICGAERLKTCLKTLMRESIAEKALKDFLTDPDNFANAEKHKEASRLVWSDLLHQKIDASAAISDQSWLDTCSQMMKTKNGIESLLLLAQSEKPDLESRQLAILNSILEKTVNVENDKECQHLWNTFINCDHDILIKVFTKHSWFFEEFFEFVIRTAHEFTCTYDDDKITWQGTAWLTYIELVSLVQWLWNVEGYISGYVQHILTQTKGKPIWQDVRQQVSVTTDS